MCGLSLAGVIAWCVCVCFALLYAHCTHFRNVVMLNYLAFHFRTPNASSLCCLQKKSPATKIIRDVNELTDNDYDNGYMPYRTPYTVYTTQNTTLNRTDINCQR